MGRARNRTVFRKSLQIQTLERREVFAGEVLASLATIDVAQPWSPIDSYIANKFNETAVPSDKLAAGLSETDFDAKLKELVGKYWEGVFGKRPDEVMPPVVDSYWYGSPIVNEFVTVRADVSLMANTSAFAGNRSITNTRHENIDEGDMVDMTDDGYLYTISGNSVQAVDLRDPANVSVKTAFALENSFAQIFAKGDSLIVVESVYAQLSISNAWNSGYESQTKVTVYDISERMTPRAVTSTVVEGSNLAARLTNDQLTLVQSHNTRFAKPALVLNAEGVERYELLDSYYATNRDSILAVLRPEISQTRAGEVQLDTVEAGTWDDLSFANDSLSQQTTILRFDVTEANSLVLADTETITGISVGLVYQGTEDIYLVAQNWSWGQTDSSSYIYKIDATAGGQLKTLDVVKIKGRVTDSTWLNEHNGVLQVASLETIAGPERVVFREATGFGPGQFIVQTTINRANVTTVGETDSGWAILGTLEDIGDGQSLLAANFIGDRAVLTTGIPQFFDPLHGIDLSDPTKPVELSELTIPGFTTYLKQIDETHWLGFGFDQNLETRVTYLQVSLYQVEDLANPVVVDRWTSSDPGWGQFWDPHSIGFDPATGLVTMSSSQMVVADITYSLPLLKVDVDAEDALTEVGKAVLPQSILRGFTLGDVFVAVGTQSVTTFDVSDLTKPLGTGYIANYDGLGFYWMVPAGGIAEMRLADQWAGEPFVITAINTNGQIGVVLNPDQSITLTATPSAYGASQSLTLTLQFESGHTRIVTGQLYASPTYAEPTYSTDRGSVQGQFEDDDGNAVTELAAGDEVWVTISASDSRDMPSGVFAAYVDVTFVSQNFTVLDIEYLGPYVNGKSGTVSATGIKSLGAFGGSTLPGEGKSDIARFKIRVNDSQPVTLTFKQTADEIGHEFLVYGSSKALDPANISSSMLSSQMQTLRTVVTAGNQQQDVNADGVITALDVLQVVNYINARNSASSETLAVSVATSSSRNVLDITGDGVVSAADVLQIVNSLNEVYAVPPSGEGGSLSSAAVDQLMAVDMDLLRRPSLRDGRPLANG